MTAFTFEGRSNRNSGRVTLYGSVANLADTDQDHAGSLPAGFGDCLLHKVTVEIGGVVTFITNVELESCFLVMTPVGGVFTEVVGRPTFNKYSATGAVAHIELWRPVSWYMNETLRLVFGNIDTNVAASSDLYVHADVLRLRST